MSAVDFRGTPLQVGDIVAATMGARRHELQAHVVSNLNPKTVRMIKLDAIEAFERENGVQVADEGDLMAVLNSEQANWYNTGSRQFRMVVRLSSLRERENKRLNP